MPNSPENLTISQPEDAIMVVAFNRPDSANALNKAMAMDIKHLFDSLPGKSLRAVVLTGQGRHFCAGADLKERKGMDEAQWHAQHHAFEEALQSLLRCDIPVIAAVNGSAFGGGLELALGCDFIYAADNAKFGLTETTLGIIPGLGGTQSLPRSIGTRMAKELVFLGRSFTAAEAYQWGMVNRVCAPDALLPDALATARSISANGPLAVKAAKKAINEGISMPLSDGLKCELFHYNTLLKTHDRHEGVNAFNEKRKARFTGS